MARKKLNFREKVLARIKSSVFKLRYSYREYRFTREQLLHSASERPVALGDLFSIRNSLNTLSLVLAFHISLGLSARKTAYALNNIFALKLSYQTVLNYTEAAAYYLHPFHLANKGSVDNIQVGDTGTLSIGLERERILR